MPLDAYELFHASLEEATITSSIECRRIAKRKIIDLLRKKKIEPDYVLSFITMKLSDDDPNVIFLSIDLLDYCMMTCGHHFYDEIASLDYMKVIRNLIDTTPFESVRSDLLHFIQDWNLTLPLTSNCAAIQNEEENLELAVAISKAEHEDNKRFKGEGYNFPYCEHNYREARREENEEEDLELAVAISKFEYEMNLSGRTTNSSRRDNEANDCSVCFEHKVNSVLDPCGHICMCYDCSYEQWKGIGNGNCPVCREEIKEITLIA